MHDFSQSVKNNHTKLSLTEWPLKYLSTSFTLLMILNAIFKQNWFDKSIMHQLQDLNQSYTTQNKLKHDEMTYFLVFNRLTQNGILHRNIYLIL